MNLKKWILIGSLTLAGTLSFSADFGGFLESYSKLGSPAFAVDDEFETFSLTQEEHLKFWFRHSFDKALYIAAETDVYLSTKSTDLSNSDALDNIIIPNLTLLKFSKRLDLNEASLTVNAGRFGFSDLTVLVLSQSADGLSLSFDKSRVGIKVYGNYTGLLNAQTVTILNDYDSEYMIDDDKSWYFAAPYANAGIQIEFPYLFANQTLSAEFLSSFGVDGPESGTSDYNRWWGTLALNGFLHRYLCYVFTTTLESEFDSDISNLTSLTFTCLPNFKSMALSLFGIYASGDHFGLKPFKGFTSMTAANSYFEPEYSGLLKSGLSVSIKPVPTIYIKATSSVLFSCPEDDFSYTGLEAGLNGVFQIISDFNITAGITQFFGDSDLDSKGTAVLSARLAF